MKISQAFTFGQVVDLVETIVENATDFEGTYPGTSNLRNLGPKLQVSNPSLYNIVVPINLVAYRITNKESDAVKAIRFAKQNMENLKDLVPNSR